MALSQWQLCVLPHRSPRLNPSSSSCHQSPLRKYMPCRFWCMESSSSHGRSFITPNRSYDFDGKESETQPEKVEVAKKSILSRHISPRQSSRLGLSSPPGYSPFSKQNFPGWQEF